MRGVSVGGNWLCKRGMIECTERGVGGGKECVRGTSGERWTACREGVVRKWTRFAEGNLRLRRKM